MRTRLLKLAALVVLVSAAASSCAREQSPPTFTLPDYGTPPIQSTSTVQPSTTFSQEVTRQELLKRLIPSGEQFQSAVVRAGVFSSAQILSEQALELSTDTADGDQAGWSRTWQLADKAGARSYVTLSAVAYTSDKAAKEAAAIAETAAGRLTASGVHKSADSSAPSSRAVRLTAAGQVSLATGAVMLLVVWEGPASTTKIEESIASAMKEWQSGLEALATR